MPIAHALSQLGPILRQELWTISFVLLAIRQWRRAHKKLVKSVAKLKEMANALVCGRGMQTKRTVAYREWG